MSKFDLISILRDGVITWGREAAGRRRTATESLFPPGSWKEQRSASREEMNNAFCLRRLVPCLISYTALIDRVSSFLTSCKEILKSGSWESATKHDTFGKRLSSQTYLFGHRIPNPAFLVSVEFEIPRRNKLLQCPTLVNHSLCWNLWSQPASKFGTSAMCT